VLCCPGPGQNQTFRQRSRVSAEHCATTCVNSACSALVRPGGGRRRGTVSRWTTDNCAALFLPRCIVDLHKRGPLAKLWLPAVLQTTGETGWDRKPPWRLTSASLNASSHASRSHGCGAAKPTT